MAIRVNTQEPATEKLAGDALRDHEARDKENERG